MATQYDQEIAEQSQGQSLELMGTQVIKLQQLKINVVLILAWCILYIRDVLEWHLWWSFSEFVTIFVSLIIHLTLISLLKIGEYNRLKEAAGKEAATVQTKLDKVYSTVNSLSN